MCAVEARRGCGYRKVGGLYMVGGGIGIPCDRLPFELSVCPCCSQGIKPARGWTWIDVAKLFQGAHLTGQPLKIFPGNVVQARELCPCATTNFCPLCVKPEVMGKAGLLWIGERFYKTPDQFIAEGVSLGFSRRIKSVPQGFKIGETWVMLAHAKAIVKIDWQAEGYSSGIFYVWLPQRLERIRLESERDSAEVQADAKRGIQSVYVPDNDVDHKGSVYDKTEEAS